MKYPKVKGKICRLLPCSLKFASQELTDKAISDNHNTQIFVKGFLRLHWDHQFLHNVFSKFGQIISAKVSLDKDHNSKGYGYVQFEKEEQAQYAITLMD